jgi:hypothetical protein
MGTQPMLVRKPADFSMVGSPDAKRWDLAATARWSLVQVGPGGKG